MSKVSRFILATALALTASGCSTAIQGTPNAAPSNPASQSGAPDAQNPFGSLKPCAVLDQLLQGQGYPPSVPSTGAPKNSCNSQKPSEGTIGILLLPNAPYDKNITFPSKAKKATVNGRQAIEQREGVGKPGDCDITMEVLPGSRASVIATGQDTDKSCKKAEELSVKLEPLLPR